MSATARIAALALASLCALGAACGGGAAPEPAKSGKSGGAGKGEEGKGEEGAGDVEEEAPRASACADGTCLECGGGLCPKGFYCDEKAPGGAACAWLPECAASATCACVKQVLGGSCSCSEKAGGPSVSCQGP